MGAGSPLGIQVESRNGVVHIALAGELDMLSVPQLMDGVKRAGTDGASALVLDLRDLTFIDSTGLHAFVNVWKDAQSNGHRLVLVGVRDSAKRLFEISGTQFLLDGQDPATLLDQFTRDPVRREVGTESADA